MNVTKLRAIATKLSAFVTDRRKTTALVAGIRNYSQTVLAGTERIAIKRLLEAVTLAIGLGADKDLLNDLKTQINQLKAQLKATKTTVKFDSDSFQIPYSYAKGTVTRHGIDYRFVCYYNAPTAANEARLIDPTFDISVKPSIKIELREVVKSALTVAWNNYRFNVLNPQSVA